ncbi:MAG: radical SAM family heme chaperone HemW [Desulfobulbaceae bacterium]|nr:radical SAM family heme chaperone HemW [Desulfobulbaceae bacterium]
MAALYLHIPFCLSKCHYCSFSSCAGGKELYGSYVAALITELTRLAETKSERAGTPGLETLFVGGGTPTCLPSELLQGVIRSSLALFAVAPDAEVSVEANPGTVDVPYLESLLQVGVNRLSLGVQSFDNQELELIGRAHNEKGACSAVKAARTAGFDNINLDLMYGLPGQTPDSWLKTLEKGLSFLPEHLSLYQLTIEPETPFHTLVENNNIKLPAEEEIIQMDAITAELCSSAGLHQYETSNYAIKGNKCRHNINYWLNDDYLAAGASAVSCTRGIRERRIADSALYIQRINRQESVVIERENLSREDSFRETVIMGLRMVQGVSRIALYERYSLDLETYYGATLAKLLDFGFLELTATHLRLTSKGWPLSNQIMAELV